MTVDVHPALAGLILLAVVWLVHRLAKPCSCCTHRSHNPEDFK